MGKTGEILALLTALCWTITAVCFEIAGKKIGSLTLNLIRLVIAFIFIAFYGLFFYSSPVPINVPIFTWKWLLISGFIGFVAGDYFLFKGFIYVGSRISMLVMSLVPVFTSIIDLLFLGQELKLIHVLGMIITIVGISLVILDKGFLKNNSLTASKAIRGILYSILGAIGQAAGLIFSKYGMKETDAFIATQIRIISAIIGFSIIIIILKRGKHVINALKDKHAMLYAGIGSFFGPFIGVSLSLASVKYTAAGIASTLMAIVPILLLVPSLVIFHQKLTIKDAIGAFISFTGVSLLFLF